VDNCRVKWFGLTLLFWVLPSFASQDPTAPLNWVSPKPRVNQEKAKIDRVPVLQSIVCRNGSSCYAVLNDTFVKVNDTVSGYEVKKITSKEVVVVRGSMSHELILFKSDIKN